MGWGEAALRRILIQAYTGCSRKSEPESIPRTVKLIVVSY